MRYVYMEPVLTTVTDEEVTDDATMLNLFKKIKDMGHSVSMSFIDEDNPGYVRNADNVRIMSIDETNKTLDIQVFHERASAKYKTTFDAIHKVKIVANRQALSSKYKVSRFHHMDVAEIDEM